MNCDTAIEYIDQYLNGEVDELDSELKQHMKDCHTCGEYWVNGKKANEIIGVLHNFKPVIDDPSGLTANILDAISDEDVDKKSDKIVFPLSILHNIHFRRFLSAAAIILFAVFVREQYFVLDKVNRLELQYQQITKDRNTPTESQMHTSVEAWILRNVNAVKYQNKELLDKLNSVNNNLLLLELNDVQPEVRALVANALYADFNEQKEFSSRFGYNILKRKLFQKQD